MLARFAANGTWLTPTLVTDRGRAGAGGVTTDARLRYVPPALAARWASGVAARSAHAEFERRMLAASARFVALAHRSGVGILAGTDASDEAYVFAGSGVHDELVPLADAGLTPLEALRAATLNLARYLGAADTLGSVAPGKVADLVLLDGDPLADVRNVRRVHAVVSRGRLLDAAARQRLLADAEAAARAASVSPPARQ